MKPNPRFPANPPTHKSDPSHEASLTSSGPEARGVSSDCRSKRVGDSQAIPAPWAIAMIFAGIEKISP